MVTVKTDNDRQAVKAKVALRWAVVDALLLDRPARVLDAFAGYGRLWRRVAAQGPQLEVAGIDHNRAARRVIHADNRRVLAGVDLAHFDVIDLDAYGVPAEQAEVIAGRGFGGVVVWTCITTMLGGLPRRLLASEGIPEEWAVECPSLMGSRDAEDLAGRWCEYLGRLGWSRHVAVIPTSLSKVYGISNPPPGLTHAAITKCYNVL